MGSLAFITIGVFLIVSTKVKHTLVIKRPVEEIFAFLTVPENMPKWADSVKESVQTSEGEPNVGTTCHVVSKAMGMTVNQDFVVTEHEANRLYSVKTTSGPFPMKMAYTLEPVEDGTRVHVESEADLKGVISVAGPILNRLGQKKLEEDHKNLKKLLESGIAV